MCGDRVADSPGLRLIVAERPLRWHATMVFARAPVHDVVDLSAVDGLVLHQGSAIGVQLVEVAFEDVLRTLVVPLDGPTDLLVYRVRRLIGDRLLLRHRMPEEHLAKDIRNLSSLSPR